MPALYCTTVQKESHMAKLKLKATDQDLNTLHACIDGTRKSSEFVKVPKDVLQRVLVDHGTICGKLRPHEVE